MHPNFFQSKGAAEKQRDMKGFGSNENVGGFRNNLNKKLNEMQQDQFNTQQIMDIEAQSVILETEGQL